DVRMAVSRDLHATRAAAALTAGSGRIEARAPMVCDGIAPLVDVDLPGGRGSIVAGLVRSWPGTSVGRGGACSARTGIRDAGRAFGGRDRGGWGRAVVAGHEAPDQCPEFGPRVGSRTDDILAYLAHAVVALPRLREQLSHHNRLTAGGPSARRILCRKHSTGR